MKFLAGTLLLSIVSIYSFTLSSDDNCNCLQTEAHASVNLAEFRRVEIL